MLFSMRPLLPLIALVFLLGLGGCLHDSRPWRDRGAASVFDTAPEVKAPLEDRCVGHGKSSVRTACEDAKYLASLYARRLSPGDGVCLEGGFGEAPLAACLARASVVDVSQNRALIEVREARPDSRWYQRVQNQVWFEEGALVDLYLAEHGY